MQLKQGDMQKALYLIGTLSFLVCIHIVSVYVFAVDRFAVEYDPLFTQKASAEIQAYLEEQDVCKKPLEEVAHSLLDAFACVRAVSCRQLPNSCLLITVQADPPYIKLDDDRLVTEHNQITFREYYDQHCLSNLATLHVCLQADATSLSQEIFNFVKKLDAHYIAQGAIVWRHRNEIQLELNGSSMQLICTVDLVPDAAFFERCATIFKEFEPRLTAQQRISADVRFADQIVVSKVKV